MPKRISEKEQLAMLQAVARFPASASIDEIGGALGHAIPRRTLQRRIALLVSESRLIPESEGRGRRYRLPPPERDALTPKPVPGGIRYSPDAEAIREHVALPISSRKPVGYDRAFLDRYRPNESFYLTAEIRAYLASLGVVPDVRLPPGTYVRQVLNRLLIDLSWNSSRLEGNTYSLLDTQQLIAFGKSAAGKSARDAQMILNHKEAIEFLVETVGEIGFNRYTIMNLHGLLANNLLADPAAVGRLRTIEVGISNSVFIPLGIPQLISEIFDQILEKASAIENPFERAFFVTVHLPYLQPFDDVNKRVSRLAANIPFLQNNLSPLSFVDVPGDLYIHGIKGVYELNRIELLRDVFVWAYQRSADRYAAIQHSIGEPDPFRMKYRDEMKSLIFMIVTDTLDAPSALKEIQQEALLIPKEDSAKFIEAVETELLSLHEGNIARYKIRSADFAKWKKAWN